MKIKALSEFVWIKPDTEPTKTKSGIEIVAKDKPTPSTGIVSARGQAVDDEIKVGSKVSYRKYPGDNVTIDKVEYYVVKQEEILAVLV